MNDVSTSAPFAPGLAPAGVSLWPARRARRRFALPAVMSVVVHTLAAAWLLTTTEAPRPPVGLDVRIVDRRPGAGGAPRAATPAVAARRTARRRPLTLASVARPAAAAPRAVAVATAPAADTAGEADLDGLPGGGGGAGVGDGEGAGGGGAGTGGAVAVAEPRAARPRDLEAVSERLRRYLVYPARARRAHWEGRVILAFVLRADGSVCGLRVATSSGSDVLDAAALEAVGRAAPFAPPGVDVRVEIPVTFRLG